MDDGLLSIGQAARAGGLSVSALRFYDHAGILGPHEVDPVTGYRRYGSSQLREVSLLARLRRIGLPLSDLRTVMGAIDDGEVLRRVLLEHAGRLADGLALARQEIEAILAGPGGRSQGATTVELVVGRAELLAALRAVAPVLRHSEEMPVLDGALLEQRGGSIWCTGSDRHRIVRAQVEARGGEGPLRVVVPGEAVRALIGFLGGTVSTEARLTAADGELMVQAGAARIEVTGLDADYPRIDHLVDRDDATGILLAPEDVADLLSQADGGGPRRLALDDEGRLRADLPDGGSVALGAPVVPVGASDAGPVRVDAGYLREALGVVGGGQLVLEIGGPLTPLAIRSAEGLRVVSVIAPIAPIVPEPSA